MKTNKLHQAVDKWRKEHIQSIDPPFNPTARAESLADEIQQAIETGQPLIAIKAMTYDGKKYKVGDEIKLGGGLHDSKIIHAGGYVITKERWDTSHANSFFKDYLRNVLDPLERQLGEANEKKRKAGIYVVQCEAELERARSLVESADDEIKKFSKELQAALELEPEQTARA